MDSHQPTEFVMDAEFNTPEADLILRSSDNVDFATHRLILQLTSTVFSDMLSLPQEPVPDAALPAERPVVHMSEDAQSLRLLLKLCYPRSFCDKPNLSAIKDIKRTAAHAEKYHIAFLRQEAEQALLRYSNTSPSSAFVVAWRFHYEGPLRAAARKSLDVPEFFKSIADIGDTLENEEVTGTAFVHLIRYHCDVRAELERMQRSSREHPIAWIDPPLIDAVLMTPPTGVEPMCNCASTTLWFSMGEMERPVEWRVYSWWWNYVYGVLSTLQREHKPPGLEKVLDEPIFDCMRYALLCNSCSGGAVVARVLDRTRTVLLDEIEKRLRAIPLPLGMVSNDLDP